MPAPPYLDTTRSDWKRQANRKANCKSCGEVVLWLSFVEGQKEIWRPYNDTDGQLHFRTCPDRHAHRTAQEVTAKPKHTCPVEGCNVSVDHDKLMCAKHWRMISEETQAKVWKEFKARPGSERHLQACAFAVDEVNAKLAKKSLPPPNPAPQQWDLFGGQPATEYPD